MSVPLDKMTMEVNRSYHVLQVCPERFLHRGGTSRIAQRLIEGLPSQVGISLACPEGKTNGLSEVAASRLRKTLAIPQARWSPATAGQFSRAIEQGGFDLVHFHDGGTFGYDLPAPWRSPLHRLSARVPWIYSNHCVNNFDAFIAPDDPAPRRALKRIVGWASKAWALHRCSAEVLDSRENESRLKKWFPQSKKKMRTIYHSGLKGVRPEYRHSSPAICLGNLGHIGRRKGQADLLESFLLLLETRPNLRLVLMGDDGDGSDAESLRKIIARRNLNNCVSMPGGSNDTSAFWRDVDIYIQPSHYEGMPMSLVEAMWHGKPCVATRVSGIPEVAQDDVNALLCDPHRPDQLADAIARLIDDGQLRERLGRAAQDSVEKQGLTQRHMVARYLELYREALQC